jgi:hypothetical protein
MSAHNNCHFRSPIIFYKEETYVYSIALAKKYGLGQYLDKPAELNDAIFHLMLLQETIQRERARKKKTGGSAGGTIAVTRIAYGKFIAACSGDEKYRHAVETALKASTNILAVIQRNRFAKVLQSMGLPEENIAEFCDTITIDDNTHCVDQD